MTWKGGAGGPPVSRGYLLWEGGCSHSSHSCLRPRCSSLSIPWRERKETELQLKADSLPVVPRQLEGRERSEKGLSTQTEGREGEPGRVQDGGGKTADYRSPRNSERPGKERTERRGGGSPCIGRN